MAGSEHDMSRRRFLKVTSGSVAATFVVGGGLKADARSKTARPNILWISTEDISPDLGCYGDTYAVTPNIDRLAAEGVRYANVFSHSGVCAPTRSGIITGMYPTTIGTHHMRCKGVPPAHVKCFSEYLRAAGYYCTNNVKTDYQFDPPLTAWDESSRNAHWRKRANGQPFFAIFNFTTSHESQIRNRSEKMLERLASLGPDERHDPAKAVLPPYYPDTPEVRKDWAQYYDIITLMDKQVADVLKQLEDGGLADDTIVWFWGDHGRGLPRGKRWIYDAGLHIPLIIRVPKKWRKLASPRSTRAVRPGTVNDDLIAFIDFAPTMLSLAGVKIPEHIQGRAFLGSQKAKPRQYIYAARDRMDEAYDLIRAVRDRRYKYIRNYMHHVSYGQDIDYMNQMPTMREMRRLNAEGKLEGPQKLYFLATKPVEELYDTQSDPHEVKNLTGDPKYKDVLVRMRKAHNEWVRQTGDMGLIPEPEFDEMKRPGGKYEKTEPPYVTVKNKTEASATVTLSCWTDGASIAYEIGDVGDKKTGWKLYTTPVALKQGEVLRAKACRIGFTDSDEIKYKLGDPVSTPPKPVAQPHWRQSLDKTNLLDRLRNIKALDGKGGPTNYLYLKGIKDNYASVRYWAAVGLHVNAGNPADMVWATTALKLALKDPAPVVRIAAAHALCDWGHEEEALPVLTEALKCDTDKARLFAIIAMAKIGEKARPALPAIKAMSKDKDNYVQRVARAVLKQLESSQDA